MPELSAQVVLEWAHSALGPVDLRADRSWSHGESCVLEVGDRAGQRFYVKQIESSVMFERELAAYRDWVPVLGDRAPRLIAYDGALQVLAVNALPGQVGTADDPDAHRQAGALLRLFHDAAPAEPWPEFAQLMSDKLEDWLRRGEGLLGQAEQTFARAQVRALADLPAPNRQPCHLDYQPRNWLVDDGGTVRVIDFGHSRLDVWARDLNRVYFNDWWERPELEAAFLEGYGRPLEGADLALLTSCGAHAAVTSIVWARDRGDAEFDARGRRQLARLMARAS